MLIDAVVLAGGRGRRLDGAVKAGVDVAGRSLLDRAVAAVVPACRSVVVVVDTRAREEAATVAARHGDTVRVQVEDPPYGGPTAGIRAGLTALDDAFGTDPATWTLCLACDLANPGQVVARVLDGLAGLGRAVLGTYAVEGVVLTDPDGRRQWVAGAYRTRALRLAITGVDSLRAGLDGLRLVDLPSPAEVCADVDTDADLRAVRDLFR